jgi:hypothetical protein
MENEVTRNMKMRIKLCLLAVVLLTLNFACILDSFILIPTELETVAKTLQSAQETAEAIGQTAQLYLEPVSNLMIIPGDEGGELIMTWEHPLGDQVNYEIFLSSQQIMEETWDNKTIIQVSSKDFATKKNNGTYQIEYHFQNFPLQEIIWVQVRQSIKGVSNAEALLRLINTIIHIDLPDDLSDVPPSILAPSNMVSVIDSGIRPKTDGLRFSNADPKKDWGIESSDYIDIMRDVYGSNSVCLDTSCNVPRRMASLFASQYFPGGKCFGFTNAVGLMVLPDKIRISEFRNQIGGKAKNIYEIDSSKEIYSIIIAYHMLQTHSGIMDAMKSSSDMDPSDWLRDLENLLISTTSQPNLSFFGTCGNQSGGHSVLPYMLVNDYKENYSLWIYDNNHEFGANESKRSFTLDFDKGLWQYQLFDKCKWSGDLPSKSISNHDINLYEDYRTGFYYNQTPWNNSNISIIVNGGITFRIMNKDGEIIATNQTKERPSRLEFHNHNVIDDLGTAFITLPNEVLFLEIIENEANDLGFMVMSQNQAFLASNVTTDDVYRLSSGMIEYEAKQANSPPEFTIIQEENSRSSSISIYPQLTQPGRLAIYHDLINGQFKVASDMNFSYDLLIQKVTVEDETRFVIEGIILAADETSIVEYEGLNEDSEYLEVGFDTNNDGMPDYFELFENECEPDEDESKKNVFPKEKKLLTIFGIIVGFIILVSVIVIILKTYYNGGGNRPGPSSRNRNHRRNSRITNISQTRKPTIRPRKGSKVSNRLSRNNNTHHRKKNTKKPKNKIRVYRKR